MAIYPDKDRIEKMMQGPADQPVVMVNLLKFKERADASEGDATGQVAYGRYAEQMQKVVESQGGRFIWAGRVDSQVIGEDGDPEFDVVALVEYPSRQKFIEIASSQKVSEIGEHRSAGLEMQWLIATTEGSLGALSE
jgi:uncharacterized protein (DUF1330 family)